MLYRPEHEEVESGHIDHSFDDAGSAPKHGRVGRHSTG
jgi:hypothetical protein